MVNIASAFGVGDADEDEIVVDGGTGVKHIGARAADLALPR